MIHEVVGALIVQSQMILLGQRSSTRAFYPNVWDVFGGHIEPGEQRHATLVRELQEELGITPIEWSFVETLVASIPASRTGQSDQLALHLYLVTAWSGTPVNRQLHEHSSIQWFSLAQTAQLDLAHPAYSRLFATALKPASAR